MFRHKNTKINVFKNEIRKSRNRGKFSPKEVAILELYDLIRGHFKKKESFVSNLVLNYKYVFSQTEMDKLVGQMDKWEYAEYFKWRELIDITERYDLIGYNYFLEMINYFYQYNLIFNQFEHVVDLKRSRTKDSGKMALDKTIYPTSSTSFYNLDEIYEKMAVNFNGYGRFLVSVLINQLILSSPFNEEEDLLTIKAIKNLFFIKMDSNQNTSEAVYTFNERMANIIDGYIEVLITNLKLIIEDQLIIMKNLYPFCFSEFLSVETIERFILKIINKYFPLIKNASKTETIFT